MTATRGNISASDEEIARALQDAHLPSLINSLIHLTGDRSLLETDIRPRPMTIGSNPSPYPPNLEASIRERALDVIKSGRDDGFETHDIDNTLVLGMMNFITGVELSDDYIPYLLQELDVNPKPKTTPAVSKSGRDFHVLIIGAGMSGLLAAIKMQELGIRFTIIEKNEDVGGTWFENRYPGCRVDSPNHVYSYSFKSSDWPQHFSDQKTLLRYFQDTADEFQLRGNIRFQTEVTSLRYENGDATWAVEVETDGGKETIQANAVISAVGQLNRPKLPDLEGIATFEGPSFHSAEWDHSVDLSGKRVVIIGTGASAFQFTPEVVKVAKEVTVFLRTPPWVATNPMYHEYISDETHWLLNHVPYYADWFRFHMFWTSGEGLLSQARCDDSWNDSEHSVSPANDRLREVLTKGLEHHLEGREDLIQLLTPKYPPTAKRMLIDNGHWYRSLSQDHVRVIKERIDGVNAHGVLTESNEQIDADVIIYGTGFSASKFLYPMRIYGKDGRELREAWQEDPRAYLGVTMPNYPNFFCLYGPNTNLVVNGSIIFFSECEMQYITESIRYLIENDLASMDCKVEPFLRYNNFIDEANLQMAWGASDVNAWYKNAEGRVTQCWPGSLVEFWKQLREMNPDDYTFDRVSQASN